VIDWLAYSPDLNLIEHVWNWMKNWIDYKLQVFPLSLTANNI
jgi:transposase